jgi:hypothetical protein
MIDMPSSAQGLDHFEDAVARLRIDAHGGFVHENELRTGE